MQGIQAQMQRSTSNKVVLEQYMQQIQQAAAQCTSDLAAM